MAITSGIIAGGGGSAVPITTVTVTSDYTVTSSDRRVEVDATSGNIIITLPTITDDFKNKDEILFKRIDTSQNTVTFVGTSSNFEDENIQIGNDPQMGILRIYASNANTWRTTGII